MSPPLVSIITVSHNYGHYLHDCFVSVRDQSFQDYEHIVVDCGSKDETGAQIYDYQRISPKGRVVAIYRKEWGLCAPKNHALRCAQGAYVVSLDADDKLAPTFLEKLVAQAGDQTIVCPGLVEFEGGTNAGWPADHLEYEDFKRGNRIFCASMYPREAARAVGGYDEKLDAMGFEDWCLWLDLLKAGCHVKVVPELLFLYRGNAANGNNNSRRTAHFHNARVCYIQEKHA